MAYFFYVKNSGILILLEDGFYYENLFQKKSIKYQNINSFEEGIFWGFPSIRIRDNLNTILEINTRVPNFKSVYKSLRNGMKKFCFKENTNNPGDLWIVGLEKSYYKKLFISIFLFELIPIVIGFLIIYSGKDYTTAFILNLLFLFFSIIIYFSSINPFLPMNIRFQKDSIEVKYYLRNSVLWSSRHLIAIEKKVREEDYGTSQYIEFRFQKNKKFTIPERRLMEFGYYIDRFYESLESIYNQKVVS